MAETEFLIMMMMQILQNLFPVFNEERMVKQ